MMVQFLSSLRDTGCQNICLKFWYCHDISLIRLTLKSVDAAKTTTHKWSFSFSLSGDQKAGGGYLPCLTVGAGTSVSVFPAQGWDLSLTHSHFLALEPDQIASDHTEVSGPSEDSFEVSSLNLLFWQIQQMTQSFSVSEKMYIQFVSWKSDPTGRKNSNIMTQV